MKYSSRSKLAFLHGVGFKHDLYDTLAFRHDPLACRIHYDNLDIHVHKYRSVLSWMFGTWAHGMNCWYTVRSWL